MAITSAWTRKCKVTINGATKISGSHSSYTVFLNHSVLPSEALDADGSYPANSDGGDIRFALNADGTGELARDIIVFTRNNNPALGLALIAINIPSITNADKDIYMFYNNPSASDYARTDTYGRNNAYDSNWVLYLPLVESGNGTAGEYKDRTVNDNNGTGGGGDSQHVPTRETGFLLYQQAFVEETYPSSITVPNSASLSITGTFTGLIWVNRSSSDAGYSTAFYKGDSWGAYFTYALFIASNDTLLAYSQNTQKSVTTTSTISDNNNHLIGWTNNGTNNAGGMRVYIDGVDNANGTGSSGMLDNSNPLTLGVMPPPLYDNPSLAKYAEMSLHNINRSEDWITSYYNNISNAETFFTVGTPGSNGGVKKKGFMGIID